MCNHNVQRTLVVLIAVFMVAVVHWSFVNAEETGSQLIDAAGKGEIEKVREMLNKGADVNYKKDDGVTALMPASLLGHTKVVKMLIEAGANVNARNASGATALLWASVSGRTPIVRLLLANGADPMISDEKGRTAFAAALKKGHTEIVTILRPYMDGIPGPTGTPTVAKDSPLNQKLLNAAASGDVVTVTQLLDGGVNIETKDEESSGTPLIWASFEGHNKVIKLLVERGANVNAQSDGGWSPLLMCCAQGRHEDVDLLLEKGADIDAKSKDGLTALGIAKQKGDAKMIQILMDHCAGSLWGKAEVKKVEGRKKCLRVRSGPSSSYAEVGCVGLGELLKLTGLWSENNWAEIFEPVKGWVSAEKINTTLLPRDKRAVLSFERVIQGRPQDSSSQQRGRAEQEQPAGGYHDPDELPNEDFGPDAPTVGTNRSPPLMRQDGSIRMITPGLRLPRFRISCWRRLAHASFTLPPIGNEHLLPSGSQACIVLRSATNNGRRGLRKEGFCDVRHDNIESLSEFPPVKQMTISQLASRTLANYSTLLAYFFVISVGSTIRSVFSLIRAAPSASTAFPIWKNHYLI